MAGSAGVMSAPAGVMIAPAGVMAGPAFAVVAWDGAVEQKTKDAARIYRIALTALDELSSQKNSASFWNRLR